MESTEKCEAIITHFNGKYIKTPPGVPAPSDPLLCKFADGGPKKRQNQGKFVPNGRAWPRNGDMGGMALTYDPSTALQNGFYPGPYSLTPTRMLTQSALSPYLPSPVSSYQALESEEYDCSFEFMDFQFHKCPQIAFHKGCTNSCFQEQ